MNKVFCRKRLLSSFILAGYLILFNTSCGLDTFYVVNSPTNVVHAPVHTSNDFTDSYFEFRIGDDNPNVKFLGTDVYYKIYKSASYLESQVDDLITIANKDESDTAAKKMIENYNYKPLRAKGHEGDSVLISSKISKDTKIYIRLSDYTDLYPAQIIIGNTQQGIPVRNLSEWPSFNFSTLTSDLRPKSGDADVNSSGSSTENVWYISMFAVAIGQDANYSSLYSNVLYLGAVKIPSE